MTGKEELMGSVGSTAENILFGELAACLNGVITYCSVGNEGIFFFSGAVGDGRYPLLCCRFFLDRGALENRIRSLSSALRRGVSSSLERECLEMDWVDRLSETGQLPGLKPGRSVDRVWAFRDGKRGILPILVIVLRVKGGEDERLEEKFELLVVPLLNVVLPLPDVA